MSIEALPLGVRCNLECDYCYQQPIREAGNEGHPRYDLDAMKTALAREGFAFTVFGGEPLLMPIDDLRELFRWGLETFGASADAHQRSPNGIQTNGVLIDDEHIRMFRRYRVGIGISIDGPDELNDARSAGTLDATRAATAKSLAALDRLLVLGMVPSLIVTLTKMNASAERLPRLLDWFRALAAKGLRHVNLHLLEVDMPGVRERLSLSTEENVAALLACARLQDESGLHFNPLRDMVALLRGEDLWSPLPQGGHAGGTNCTWNGCDPYTTGAVQGVNGQGERGNCGRTCKEGPFWLKADRPGYERYLSLAYTPQAFGGCLGCRFFALCKGHCPGEGEHADWRGKTEHCATLMRVFEALEGELVRAGETPVSLAADRRAIEEALIAGWAAGQQRRLQPIREALAKGAPAAAVTVADQPHGDAPHGDHTDVARPIETHGDHTDEAGRVAWARL